MKRLLAMGALLAAALLPLLLQGCLPVVAAGASGGALAAFDRRSLGTQTDDESIEWKASARVGEKPWENVHINFTSFNRRVLISGEVPSEQVRSEVENIVNAVPQVQGLYNELGIGPVTSFSTRSKDSYITTRVKSRFVDSGKFNAIHVKVVTENGVVYLMGLVEADAAVQVARTTSDVKKVVTLFEIISDSKAKELDVSLPKSGPPAAPPSGGG